MEIIEKIKENRNELIDSKSELSKIQDALSVKREILQEEIEKLENEFNLQNKHLLEKEQELGQQVTNTETTLKEQVKLAWKEQTEKLLEEDANAKVSKSLTALPNAGVRVTKKYIVNKRFTEKEITETVKENFPMALTYNLKTILALAKNLDTKERQEQFPFLQPKDTISVVFKKEFWKKKDGS